MIYKESPNKHKRTQNITGIVIHTTVGSYAGAVSWLTNPQSGVSANYVIKEDGNEVTQCVKDDWVAYHAGVVDRPSTPVYKGGNPNEYTLGIENADGGSPAQADRNQQYPTLIKLVYDLCKKHGLPIDRNHICAHREIRASKTCPGNIDVDYVVAEARKLEGDMSKLLEHLGMPDEDSAITRLTEHLGATNGKSDWGSNAPDKGGHLGAERRKNKTLSDQLEECLNSSHPITNREETGSEDYEYNDKGQLIRTRTFQPKKD